MLPNSIMEVNPHADVPAVGALVSNGVDALVKLAKEAEAELQHGMRLLESAINQIQSNPNLTDADKRALTSSLNSSAASGNPSRILEAIRISSGKAQSEAVQEAIEVDAHFASATHAVASDFIASTRAVVNWGMASSAFALGGAMHMLMGDQRHGQNAFNAAAIAVDHAVTLGVHKAQTAGEIAGQFANANHNYVNDHNDNQARNAAHTTGLAVKNNLKHIVGEPAADAAGHLVTQAANVAVTATNKATVALDQTGKMIEAATKGDFSTASKKLDRIGAAVSRNFGGFLDGAANMVGLSQGTNAIKPLVESGALDKVYAHMVSKNGQRTFDVDGNGHIDATELMTVLHNNHVKDSDLVGKDGKADPAKIKAQLDRIVAQNHAQTPEQIKEQAIAKEEPQLNNALKSHHLENQGHLVDVKDKAGHVTHEFVSADGKKHLALSGDAAKDLIAIQAALHGAKVTSATNDNSHHAPASTPKVAAAKGAGHAH